MTIISREKMIDIQKMKVKFIYAKYALGKNSKVKNI
jgi:hypothetical protein